MLTDDHFIIGDVHGHLDRLEALLIKAELIGEEMIPANKGADCVIVQVGDLGHYGGDSRTRDMLVHQFAEDFIDIQIWGNHDRAVFDRPAHGFTGYTTPRTETIMLMQNEIDRGKIVWAYSAHGYLITHAGLHPKLYDACFSVGMPGDDVAPPLAEWLNESSAAENARNQVGGARGGLRGASGGILWRDASEDLLKMTQIFGHTAGNEVREYSNRRPDWYKNMFPNEANPLPSYCIDIGGRNDGKLAGIFLPSRTIVEVNLGAN